VRGAHLHHRSLFQPHQPAFWVYSLFLLYGLVSMTETLGELSKVSSSGWVLSWLLLTLYAVPVWVLVGRLDLYEREPVSLSLGALAWGAFAATALSIEAWGWDQVVAQTFGAEFAAKWGPAITAPFVEESMKGAGVVLIYLIARDEVDDVMDGFVYGALCGLGFAIVEDVLYFMAVFGGTPAGVLEGFYVRVLSSGLYGHVLFTGLTGMGVGYVVTRREETPLARRLAIAAGLTALGVAGHALWNSPLLSFVPPDPRGGEWLMVPLGLAVKGAPLLLMVGLAVRLAHERERRWLSRALAEEVAGDGISHDEFQVLESPGKRRRAVAEMRRRAGGQAAGLLRRLHKEQVNLAMIASRVASSDDPVLRAQREYCRSLRDALAAVPGGAPAS
jgi:RsiW-degrading membrane proteinase PrsW (M82 family)